MGEHSAAVSRKNESNSHEAACAQPKESDSVQRYKDTAKTDSTLASPHTYGRTYFAMRIES